jgi:hypothetical protein
MFIADRVLPSSACFLFNILMQRYKTKLTKNNYPILFGFQMERKQVGRAACLCLCVHRFQKFIGANRRLPV